MNRAAVVLLQVAAKVLEGAAREALNNEARSEWDDNDTRASWEIRGIGSAYASISQPGLEVTDEQAFLKWLVEKHPSEIIAVLKPRNAEWYKQIKAAYAQAMIEGKIDGVPGVKLDRGGQYVSVSVKPDNAFNSAMKHAVRLALAGDPSVLQQLFQETGYMPVLDVMPPRLAITGGPDGQAAGEDAATAEPDGGGGDDRGGVPQGG